MVPSTDEGVHLARILAIAIVGIVFIIATAIVINLTMRRSSTELMRCLDRIPVQTTTEAQ